MKRGDNNLQNYIQRIFPSARRGEMESAAREVLERLRAQMPEAVEAFRFFPDAGRKAKSLRPFQQLLMTAVSQLGDDASNLKVADKMEELTSKPVNLGSVYVWLNRMHDEGMVSSERRQDGGRMKPFFKLTEFGQRVLAAAPAAQHAVEKLGDFA